MTPFCETRDVSRANTLLPELKNFLDIHAAIGSGVKLSPLRSTLKSALFGSAVGFWLSNSSENGAGVLARAALFTRSSSFPS